MAFLRKLEEQGGTFNAFQCIFVSKLSNEN